MGTHQINQPPSQYFGNGVNGVRLTWNPAFAASRTEHFNKVQKFIDSEVLRLDDPLVPKVTGNLINSGIRGTHIGSGEVVYDAPYSAVQYYGTADTRDYDPHRGGHWFERMKAAHKDEILKGAQMI